MPKWFKTSKLSLKKIAEFLEFSEMTSSVEFSNILKKSIVEKFFLLNFLQVS